MPWPSQLAPSGVGLPVLLQFGDGSLSLHEVGERLVADLLLVEAGIQSLHLLLETGCRDPPIHVVVAAAHPQRPHHELDRVALRIGRDRLCGCRGSGLVVDEVAVVAELVAGVLEGGAGRSLHADADHGASQPAGALRERNVVRVTGHDHDVGDVAQPEEVLDDVDGEPDVGAVLRAGGVEELHQIDSPIHQLLLVARVCGRGPVGVRAADGDGPEGRREVEHGADVDGRLLQAVARRARGTARLFLDERATAVHRVVLRDHDVVEVDVDGDTGFGRVGHGHTLPGASVVPREAGFSIAGCTSP